ncbi:MAG: hypothetical protein NZ929_04655 [Aigarchaeota archaeon]|nr:hypothetical protein [Aigarchaeota archaeon]MCX8193559.1 hypothetical protein [Nitrososphaeria archaeon]MDW7986699.1 hypothetical protein [Nitrososphaerota archaeon]
MSKRKRILYESFTTLFIKPEPIISPSEEVYRQSEIPPLKKFPSIFVGSGLIVAVGLLIFFFPFLMNILGALAFSIIPVAILLTWVIKTDKYEPEPKSLILAVIGIGGCIAAIFSIIDFPRGVTYYLAKITLIEVLFFLILIGLDSNRVTGREFNDHLDGAVYGLSLGLGYILYDNFIKVYMMPSLINPLMLTLIAVEDMFISIFPALTGWWIGYVKAKYASVRFIDLLAGFIPIILIRVLYEAFTIAISSINLTLRLASVILVGVIILSILLRRVGWALEDERLWRYHIGRAPVERGGY